MKKRIRWLTAAEMATIAALTHEGKSQKEIGEKIGRHRSNIYRAQRALGLQLKRHGPRCPELTKSQEVKALELLRSGMGTSKVSAALSVGEWQVRLVAKKYRFRQKRGNSGYRWKPSKKQILEVVDLALRHQYSVKQIAKIVGGPYRSILKMCHVALGCEEFVSGSSYIDSYLPSKYRSPLKPAAPQQDVVEQRQEAALFIIDLVRRAAGKFIEDAQLIEVATLTMTTIYMRANPAAMVGPAEWGKIQSNLSPYFQDALSMLRTSQSGLVH